MVSIAEERFDRLRTAMTYMVSEATDEEDLDAMLSAAARPEAVQQLGRMPQRKFFCNDRHDAL